MSPEVPVVSVVVPTYQHAAYIEQCLEGILMQKTSFPVEILVGEDESTDGTRALCERYSKEHPDRIRLFLRSRKDVIHILGRATGRANFLDLLSKAKGKYVALCEGDDMWIASDKLQRQVDALEADPSAMGCFTNVYNDFNGLREPYFGINSYPEPGTYVAQRSLVVGHGVPTCSFIFRSSELLNVPPELFKSPVADTLLFAHLARNGPLLYLPILAGVRHVHPGGLNSMKSRAQKAKVTFYTLPYLDSITGYRYSKELSERRQKELMMHWDRAVRNGDLEMARLCWPHIASIRSKVGWNITTTLRNFVKAYLPYVEKIYSRVLENIK